MSKAIEIAIIQVVMVFPKMDRLLMILCRKKIKKICDVIYRNQINEWHHRLSRDFTKKVDAARIKLEKHITSISV